MLLRIAIVLILLLKVGRFVKDFWIVCYPDGVCLLLIPRTLSLSLPVLYNLTYCDWSCKFNILFWWTLRFVVINCNYKKHYLCSAIREFIILIKHNRVAHILHDNVLLIFLKSETHDELLSFLISHNDPFTATVIKQMSHERLIIPTGNPEI